MLLQPFASVIVTEYVVSAFAVIHEDVEPLFHKYELIPLVAHSCVEPPGQKELLPVIEHEGNGFTVTTEEVLTVH